MQIRPVTVAQGFVFVILLGGWAACSEAGLLEDGGAVDRWLKAPVPTSKGAPDRTD